MHLKASALSFYIHKCTHTAPFTVDPDNGDLILESSLDYEDMQSYNFFVLASDGGDPRGSNFAQVVVNVIDVNDNSPIFSEESYSEIINEANYTAAPLELLTVSSNH